MNRFDEELYELMIKHASEGFLDEMEREYPSQLALKGRYEFSPAFKQWTKDMIANQKNPGADKDKHRKIMTIAKRVGIAACIMFSIFSFTAFTVEPVRIAVSNFFLEKNGENYELHGAQDLRNYQESDQNTDVLGFVPYVPAGFYAVETYEGNLMESVTYENADQITIYVNRWDGEPQMTIDGEDAELEQMIIGTDVAYIFIKNGYQTILFHDYEYTYIIRSDYDKDELIKMAKGIVQ